MCVVFYVEAYIVVFDAGVCVVVEYIACEWNCRALAVVAFRCGGLPAYV